MNIVLGIFFGVLIGYVVREEEMIREIERENIEEQQALDRI